MENNFFSKISSQGRSMIIEMKKIEKNKAGRVMACLLSVCLLASLMGCGQSEAAEEVLSDSVHARVQNPKQGDLVLQNEFVGSISPEEAVYVIPMVSAEVLQTTVAVGDSVSAGDVLCRLDSEAAQLQLESAQASYESAQANADSALGGQMALQDLQSESSISQLEKQLNDLNENLTDSRNDYEDSSNSLEDVREWRDEAKESFEDAAEEYYAAEALYNKFKDAQSSAGGKAFAGMSLEEAAAEAVNIVTDYKKDEAIFQTAYETAKQELEDYINQSGAPEEELKDVSHPDHNTYQGYANAVDAAKGDLDNLDKAQYNAALTMIGLREAAKKAGVSADDVSQSGLSKLSGKMSTAQSEYTNASTQKSTLEAQKDGYDSAVDQLEDSLTSLEDNLQTARDSAAITESQIKQETQALMEAQLNAAGIGIQSAQMQLDMYTLTAPISGVVEAVNVTEHAFASSGNAAFVISNKETMTATFTVSEAIRNTLNVGQSIRVDRNGTIYQATITEIGSMVDSSTGLFKIKASVEADGNSLLTGSSVKITADTYREQDTLLLPYDAVYYENGQAYVYVVENGLAVRKDVVTGIFNEDTISILSGLTVEDKIVTTWASNLRDGVTIVTQEEGTEEAK